MTTKSDASALVEEEEQEGEKRDMATIMSAMIERLLQGLKLDCEMDAALPATFLRIVPSCGHIPLFDVAQMALIAFPPTILEKPGELERVLKQHTFDEPHIIQNVRHSLVVEIECNAMLKRTPEFYPIVLCKAAEIPFLTTEMDDTVQGLIYSVATQMPSQEHLKLQHAYYGFLTAHLFSQLRLTGHSVVRYAYLITEGNRLNLFMSVVR